MRNGSVFPMRSGTPSHSAHNSYTCSHTIGNHERDSRSSFIDEDGRYLGEIKIHGTRKRKTFYEVDEPSIPSSGLAQMLNTKPIRQISVTKNKCCNTYVELGRMGLPPLCSAFIPVPAIFKLWSI